MEGRGPKAKRMQKRTGWNMRRVREQEAEDGDEEEDGKYL